MHVEQTMKSRPRESDEIFQNMRPPILNSAPLQDIEKEYIVYVNNAMFYKRIFFFSPPSGLSICSLNLLILGYEEPQTTQPAPDHGRCNETISAKLLIFLLNLSTCARPPYRVIQLQKRASKMPQTPTQALSVAESQR